MMDKPRIILPGDGEFTETIMRKHMPEGVVLSGMLETLLFDTFSSVMGMRGMSADFGSAHYEFDGFSHYPESYRKAADNVTIETREDAVRFFKSQNSPPLKETIARIIQDETTIDLDKYTIIPAEAPTRDTLGNLFRYFSKGKSGAIAVPLPSWHFWKNCDDEDGKSFTYFDAYDAPSFIEGFKRVSNSRKVKALLMLSPANPLFYEFSKEDVAEIDQIAQKSGIEVIVDDVMRGTKSIGNRDSVAALFEKPPFVVEGFGKRFGTGLHAISYVLAPKGKRPNVTKDKDAELLSALDLYLSYEHVSKPAIDELTARNEAFDKGFLANAPEGARIHRPDPGYLIGLVHLPDSYPLSAPDFEKNARKNRVGVRSTTNYYPSGHPQSEKLPNAVRISVGKIDSSEMEEKAALLGKGMNHIATQGSIISP